jgi:hypothetical protein
MKHILLYILLCGWCGLFLGAEVPNIEKLSEAKLLKIVDRISKEVQSKRREINQLSANPTSESVLQLRMILYQDINHNLALMQEILEKRVYTTSFAEAPVLRVFSENVVSLLVDLRTKIIKACLRNKELCKRRSLSVPYKP